jgi:hypothetical protein
MRLRFDPNVRFGDETYVSFDQEPSLRDAGLTVGQVVVVYAEASRLEGKATVTDIDDEFVTLRVAWSELQIVARDNDEASAFARAFVHPLGLLPHPVVQSTRTATSSSVPAPSSSSLATSVTSPVYAA